MANNSLCPACGSAPQGQGTACPQCGFSLAFATHFSNEESHRAWQGEAKQHLCKQHRSAREMCISQGRFSIGPSHAAYYAPEDQSLFVVNTVGKNTRYEHIVQCSAAQRYFLQLSSKGTVTAQGEDTYGQCQVQQLRDITFVLAAPQASYAIDKSGAVHQRGVSISPEVATWTDMVSLACDAYQLVGLTKQGTVRVAGIALKRALVETVNAWKDKVAIAAAGDCILALGKDRRVSFAGSEDDSRKQVTLWQDVVAIAVDGVYAVGLTAAGRILLAGHCASVLDMGRKEALNWRNVVAIACTRSGIGALCSDGSLKLAGNIMGRQSILDSWVLHTTQIATSLRCGVPL